MAKRVIYSSENIHDWFEHSVNLKERRIYLSTVNFDCDGKDQGVDSLMTEYFIKGIDLMRKSNRKVTILMNNIGGDWIHGMAIYDAIRDFPAPVDIEVYGHAMSMGSIILQAGRKRLMHSNSSMMIHDGYADDGARPVQSARNWSNYEESLRRNMYKIFAERTGEIPSYWKRKCAHDTIYTAEEAVEKGLADKVVLATRGLPVKMDSKRRKKKG